jgi:outer membrane receptor protein involved in Fe transport
MKVLSISRNTLLASTALALATWLPATAHAQEADSAGGLEEIVVTAQKREQSLQDVPIAVTAVTQETLQANRIYTVNDLSAIAPGLTVKPSAGGIQTPSFTMRGQNSFGVVAGSDKQVSIYLDGIYISSPRGSIFEMPDIARLEVLRGPQGTLFGRNATAGAVSITTRDPTGDAHARLEGTVGNYDAYRVRATLETPEVGPFSGYFSYVRNYRRGEIENSQAGLLWDRSNSPSGYGKGASPRWLGTVDSNSYFAAVKFEPSDDFKMVYKYDRNDDSGTPEGTAMAAYDANPPAAGGGVLLGGVLQALYTSNGVHLNPSAKRPDIVDNGWVVARQQRVQGHSLTATWQATDSVTVKNIAAYRKAKCVFAFGDRRRQHADFHAADPGALCHAFGGWVPRSHRARLRQPDAAAAGRCHRGCGAWVRREFAASRRAAYCDNRLAGGLDCQAMERRTGHQLQFRATERDGWCDLLPFGRRLGWSRRPAKYTAVPDVPADDRCDSAGQRRSQLQQGDLARCLCSARIQDHARA